MRDVRIDIQVVYVLMLCGPYHAFYIFEITFLSIMERNLFPLPVLVCNFSFGNDAVGTPNTKYKVYGLIAVSERSKAS